ncbi:MAG: Phage uncharacterized protein-like protein [Holophagaceae bacterium]|nr:Phage uncharacterized protein-like protein [Holophagaceae bacterium]
MSAKRDAVGEFLTTEGGYRLSLGVEGGLMGRGGDIIIVDDPLDPNMAASDVQRAHVNDWFDRTLYSCLDSQKTGVIIIVMQRLHMDDLVGHVLEKDDWEVLSLPAIAEEEERHEIRTLVAEHPGLIDPEAFERAQHMLEPKVRRTRQECRNPIYLVRGAFKCGLCGRSMTSASTFRSGRLHRYYRYSTRDKQGKAVCPTVQMPAEAIEGFVVERVQKLLEEPRMRPLLTGHLERLGLQAPEGRLTDLWSALTLPNKQRLIRLLVAEVRVDQRAGKQAVQLRDLDEIHSRVEAAC